MWEGKRGALKPKKRFKDTIKYYLNQSGLPVDQWEKMAKWWETDSRKHGIL